MKRRLRGVWAGLQMRRYVYPSSVSLLPLVYYFRFIFPNSGMLLLQNDFGHLYYAYKAYLLDLCAHGHFPLWSPAEAAGYSFFASPFAAALYPPNVLLLGVRLIAGNYSTWFHQVFTVLGVSLFALGLYHWLHRVFRQPAAAAFAAMAVSTCWMVSEFLRFPNAIHALAWVPWVLASLHATHHGTRPRSVYWGVAAVLCQATAGYPYFVVFSFFLYLGYIAYLHWLSDWQGWKARGFRQALTLILPVLLTLPYTNAISHLMAVTNDRAGDDFGYATFYTYGPLDLVGSLVFPPVVTVEGCFYAGSLAVFMIVIYFWRSRDAREKVAVTFGCMGVLAVMFGFRSYLFAPLWSFTPVVNQMRVFSRMATMLLPILAVVLHQGFSLLWAELQKERAERALVPRTVLTIFGAIIVVQAYLYSERAPLDNEYAVLTIPTLPQGSKEIDFLMYSVLTLGVVLVVLHLEYGKLRHGQAIAVLMLIGVMTQDTGTQGRFLWGEPASLTLTARGAPTTGPFWRRAWAAAKSEGKFYRLVHDYFELDRVLNTGALTSQGLDRGVVTNWDYATYLTFTNQWKSHGKELDRLLGAKKLYFHAKLVDDLDTFLSDADEAETATSKPVVRYFDGSELVVELNTTGSGRLAWIDNWDAGWSARVDGVKVPIDKLLGTFKSVPLPKPGQHTVRFAYRPAISSGAYAGGIAGLLGLVLLVAWDRRQKRGQLAIAA